MIRLIGEYFPHVIIENPNQPCHQEGYANRKQSASSKNGGMGYFFEEILPNCKAGTVALPFIDGLIGAGVAGEMIFSIQKDRGCFLIETPSMVKIRPLYDREIQLLLQWNKLKELAPDKNAREKIGNELILSIEQTRKRTWLKLYEVIRPYEKAHLE